jgi:CBS-domain-containing membrane protein
VVSLASDLPLSALRHQLSAQPAGRFERLLPVVDDRGELVGVVTHTDLARAEQLADGDRRRVGDFMRREVVVAYPDDTLQTVAARMITMGVWRLPVVSRANPRMVVGLISQRELLRARERLLEEERLRERVFRLRVVTPRTQRPARPGPGRGQDVDSAHEATLPRPAMETAAPAEPVERASQG